MTTFDIPTRTFANNTYRDLRWADSRTLTGRGMTFTKMPCQATATADVYLEAHEAFEQLGRLPEVGCCGSGSNS